MLAPNGKQERKKKSRKAEIACHCTRSSENSEGGGSAMVDPKCESRDYPWRKLTRAMRKLELKNTMEKAKEKEEEQTDRSRRRCVTMRPKYKVKPQKVGNWRKVGKSLNMSCTTKNYTSTR